ncbi:MAG TPA: peptide chain release factor N(5)-glutamine methyltransferase [Firmicutes bacterium]|jgi:release factor glutamine methyltransferase|nr:peptide chain release factor N(5)-glutamine methyltransferase [Bacillota bacterium]
MSISVKEALQRAFFQLKAANCPEPQREAAVLLSAVLRRPLAWVYAHGDALLDEGTCQCFGEWVARRMRGEPYAYICGRREFMGLEISVTPAVLIPRPETELLVETAARILQHHSRPQILEIGTGSGAVAVALAMFLPAAVITAVDISPLALEVAAQNVRKHRLGSRVHLLEGDLYAPVAGRHFDAVVSNPPYISSGELASLDRTVRDYEPYLALDGGPDGLHFYRRITAEISALAALPPLLALEVGFGQAAAVCALCRKAGYERIDRVFDLAGIDRIVAAQKQ